MRPGRRQLAKLNIGLISFADRAGGRDLDRRERRRLGRRRGPLNPGQPGEARLGRRRGPGHRGQQGAGQFDCYGSAGVACGGAGRAHRAARDCHDPRRMTPWPNPTTPIAAGTRSSTCGEQHQDSPETSKSGRFSRRDSSRGSVGIGRDGLIRIPSIRRDSSRRSGSGKDAASLDGGGPSMPAVAMAAPLCLW
jgi:hypothetical protein